MKFDKEFKEAISHLSSQEKDKLILRLLKKDLNLANRLYFDLVDTDNVDLKRSELEQRIIKTIEHMATHYFSPGWLMMDMRDISGAITEHVQITKDKFGAPYLNLLMLNQVLTLHNISILETTHGKSRKLCIYIIARVFKILVLINGLHEDFFTDFKDRLENLGKLISKNEYLRKTAIQNGFDVNWLLDCDIPDNIVEIHKDIKKQGYLTSRVLIKTSGYGT